MTATKDGLPTGSPIRAVTVYGGSRTPNLNIFAEHAFELGKLIAEEGWVQINGGGYTGLMRQLTEGAVSVGGIVDSVTLDLFDSEHALTCYRERIVVKTMSERKARLNGPGDAIVALPGGIGTLEELTEVICQRHLSLHTKAIVLVNTNGFYNNFRNFLQDSVDSQLFPSSTLDVIHIVQTPKDAVHYLRNYCPVDLRNTPSGVVSGEMDAMKRNRTNANQ